MATPLHRSGGADIIPIRRTPPLPVIAIVPDAPPPSPRVRRKLVPVARRPWRVLVVPATPGAPTRAFDLARWQLRLAIVSIAGVTVVAAAAASAAITVLRTPELIASGSELTSVRLRLAATEDSLALLRSELASAALAAASAPTTATTAAPSANVPHTRRRASSAQIEDTDAEVSSARDHVIEGLPVIGAIASGFSRARWHPILHAMRPHLGLDLAARRGTHITAPAAGRVTFVGRKFAFGLVVEIEHGDGVMTRYAHCQTAIVNVGDRVARGAWIATVGSSGLTTGPHLHYEVLVNGKAVDPLRVKLPQAPAVAAPAPAEAAPVPIGDASTPSP